MMNRRGNWMSRLTQARGLKRVYYGYRKVRYEVAPHAGAWIETYLRRFGFIALVVAPHAGAWIETGLYLCQLINVWSRLTQARGLKLHEVGRHASALWSRLTQARGLKQTLLAWRRLPQSRASRRRVD